MDLVEESRGLLSWPPLADDLRRLYLEKGLSASKIAEVYGLRYASEKTAESTILYHLKRNGISRRDPAAHIRKVTEAVVDEWAARYQKGESLKQIAGDAVSPVTVFNHLHKRGVQLRDKVEAQIKAVKKFEKTPFNGNAEERAYLLGFTRGDLGVSRHGRAIRVRTSTTHPAMIELILSLFLPYGPCRVYPRFSKKAGYEWTVEAELDSSFEFLLTEKRTPPSLDAPSEIVLAYLAGLLDSEGSIWLSDERIFAPRLSFTNQDTTMLDWIESQVARLGFHSSRAKPDGNSVFKTNFWRQDELLELLRAIPMRHPVKKAKARAILKGSSQRSELAQRWQLLLQEIELDRLESINLAKEIVISRMTGVM
jgi:hypothetical protein